MAAELPNEIREKLHDVFVYLIESEAKSHYRLLDDEGEGYDTYEHVHSLIRYFRFNDLAEMDEGIQDRVFQIDDELDMEG
jgi:hypothetical protein